MIKTMLRTLNIEADWSYSLQRLALHTRYSSHSAFAWDIERHLSVAAEANNFWYGYVRGEGAPFQNGLRRLVSLVAAWRITVGTQYTEPVSISRSVRQRDSTIVDIGDSVVQNAHNSIPTNLTYRISNHVKTPVDKLAGLESI
jgi:hypothetical protein